MLVVMLPPFTPSTPFGKVGSLTTGPGAPNDIGRGIKLGSGRFVDWIGCGTPENWEGVFFKTSEGFGCCWLSTETGLGFTVSSEGVSKWQGKKNFEALTYELPGERSYKCHPAPSRTLSEY